MNKIVQLFAAKSQLSNDLVLVGLRQRNEDIINQIYDNCGGLVKGFILKNGGTINDAEDIFQESLYDMIIKVDDENFQFKSSFKQYFITIVKFKWYNQFKQNLKIAGNEDLSNDASQRDEYVLNLFEEFLEDNENKSKNEKLNKNISELKPHCQKIISMYYYHGLSYRTIAEKMDYSEKYAKLKKFRCLETLKKLMLN
ncbi:MAG: sigma-70 family RNA polymerase sigma factor [Flammeovirgaceae bacterium]|nr:sigma-70 family RNA polymerase sigma factor [Flammeovirgaceae bacterium]